MPLQNRVHPNGEITATPERGTFYGNRGGKIHVEGQNCLHPTKRWASRQWICCLLEFNNRKRPVMGKGYTELFFMDEVAALASGHRPCFECRRQDAIAFAMAWNGTASRASAGEMDKQLHTERLIGKSKRRHRLTWNDLPIGAMADIEGTIVAKSADGPLRWSFAGYGALEKSDFRSLASAVDCLTPPAILNVLKNGYQPRWHPSANQGEPIDAPV